MNHPASSDATTPYVPRLLEGQVAIVTGGGRGNGRAIAIGLARSGAQVGVADLDGATAAATAGDIAREGGRAFALQWDIADAAQAPNAVAAIHRQAPAVSILVNNAGIEGDGMIGEAGYQNAFHHVMSVNLEGTMLVTQALVADLKATRGCIVNITSMMASVSYQPGASAYAAAKAALAQWTRSLAIELAPAGVRANAVAPGFMHTAMTAGTRADPKRLAYFESRTPMKRMGQPEELVGPVLFLASRLASYVTGAIIPVDGGLVAN